MRGITLQSISKTYHSPGNEEVQALRDVTLHIELGHCVAIMGPSGSGKTTILHLLAGMLSPTAGNYLFNDIDVFQLSAKKISQLRNASIGLVSQDFALIEEMSALDNVVIPMLLNKSIAWKTLWNRGRKLLNEMGIDPTIKRSVSQLSGGQRQRVAIARARVHAPQLLLCDEPTANLDSERAAAIMEILLSAKNDTTTVIVATHDQRIAQKCDYTIHLLDGYLK